MAQTTTARRLKHWGWGYEDQQPSEHELREAAAGLRAHLGFEPADVELPVPLDHVELPQPRLEPPASLAPICSASDYERAAHAYGKAYRDVVRAFRGRFDRPPDVVARPREEADVAALLEWCAGAGPIAIPYGGGPGLARAREPPAWGR